MSSHSANGPDVETSIFGTWRPNGRQRPRLLTSRRSDLTTFYRSSCATTDQRGVHTWQEFISESMVSTTCCPLRRTRPAIRVLDQLTHGRVLDRSRVDGGVFGGESCGSIETVGRH